MTFQICQNMHISCTYVTPYVIYSVGFVGSLNIADICCSNSTYTFYICQIHITWHFRYVKTCIYLIHMSHRTLFEKICQHTVLHMLIPYCILLHICQYMMTLQTYYDMSHLSPTYVKTVTCVMFWCCPVRTWTLRWAHTHRCWLTLTGAGRGVLYLLRSCWSRSTFKFVQGASRQIQVVI